MGRSNFLLSVLCVAQAAAVSVRQIVTQPVVSPHAATSSFRSVAPNMVAELRKTVAKGDGRDGDATISGPVFSKPLSTPDPVPEEGIERAIELMRSGALFRYTPGVLSETSLAEAEICEYTGFKYSVGFNSCGSALFIALKCAGVQPGDEVLANAFSFTAVPSAIHHAGATPVYVESTRGYTMCAADLRERITPKTKFLMLTHMRGKVADMQAVYDLAREHDITVIEDCAHALGIQWDGMQLGRQATVACYSTQSAKVINSGEGGFLCTDDAEIAARAACYAGCYEELYKQHMAAPPAAVFEKVKRQTPNYSLRMSDLAAACVRPQIATLEARVAAYNERYARVAAKLDACEWLELPEQSPRVRPVLDSLQFNLIGLSDEQVQTFLSNTKRRGMPVGLFGSKDNSRNFHTWQYAPAGSDLPRTERLISAAVDVRLPLTFDESDLDLMAEVILAAVEDTVSEA